jgi:hypothetical protein
VRYDRSEPRAARFQRAHQEHFLRFEKDVGDVVRAVGAVDPGLRDRLGIDRDPDHVADVLFEAQEVLLMRALESRRPRLAPIIPLFGDRNRTVAAG